MSRKVDTGVLATLHLAILWEATNSGQITLPSGKVILPTDDAWDSLINLAKWGVVTFKERKPKFLEVPEDLGLKETKRTSDA